MGNENRRNIRCVQAKPVVADDEIDRLQLKENIQPGFFVIDFDQYFWCLEDDPDNCTPPFFAVFQIIP